MVPDCACPGQVCCRQKDYWQFVKDIRWLSPGSAHHLEKVGSAGVAWGAQWEGRGQLGWTSPMVQWCLGCWE